MAQLHEYDVIIDGNRTTLRLSEDAAAARGLTAPARTKAAPPPRNKARRAATKEAEVDGAHISVAGKPA
jgi:hypothetical protein